MSSPYYAFDTPDVQVLETLDTEQQTIKVHRNDMTFKVLWHNEDSPASYRGANPG